MKLTPDEIERDDQLILDNPTVGLQKLNPNLIVGYNDKKVLIFNIEEMKWSQ